MGRKTGFTLIELVVTLFILRILASAAVPMAQLAFKRHKEEELRRALFTIRDAIDAYKKASAEGHIAIGRLESGYPPSLDILVKGVVEATNPTERKLFFLRRIPTDPLNPDSELDDNWGKRSYESEADNPKPGADVYDVYSQSNDTGLALLRDDRYLGIRRYLRINSHDPLTRQSDWALVSAPDGGVMGIHSRSTKIPLKSGNFSSMDSSLAGASSYSDWQFVYMPPAPPASSAAPSQN